MEELSIGQICSRFSSGRNIKAANIHESGLYPVYGSNGLRGFTDSYNYDGECAIVGRQGAYCGNVKYVSGKSYMSEHAIVAKTNPNHNNKYFAYKLSLAKLGRFSGQAAQPGLSVTKLLRLKFEMPSKQYQDRIASILSAYDSLIENNTKRIRLLEKMAENLYKEWFVRFRFPGHENVEMENKLPKGWKIKRYEDELNVKYGKGLPTDRLTDKGYPVFGSNGQIGYYTSYMYEQPQILISCRGASSGVVNISLPMSFVTNNSLVCEIGDKTESVFEYLKYYFLNTNLVQYQTGSAQPQITINNIVKLKMLVPLKEVQNKFAAKVMVFDKEMQNLAKQNSLLARRRDLLLPRLMSGKLEVKP